MSFNKVTSQDELQALLTGNSVIFKHSERCGISQDRKQALQKWMSGQDITIHTIEVREQRGLSDEVEDETGVKHESPQLILIRDGEVIWHASHMSIDPDKLASQL